MQDLTIRISASGYTALYGPGLTKIVESFKQPLPTSTTHPLHITLLTKFEAAEFKATKRENPFSSGPPPRVIPLGVGTERGCTFVVVLSNAANLARKKAGLSFKDLHISLDVPPNKSPEEFSHGLSTLPPGTISSPPFPSPEIFDALALHYFMRSDLNSSLDCALAGIGRYPADPRSYVRLGDVSRKFRREKVAMLGFGRAYEEAGGARGSLRKYCVQQILNCSESTEWGVAATETEVKMELEQLPERVRNSLMTPWGTTLRDEVLEGAESWEGSKFCLESREKILVPFSGGEMYRLQRFFRWIVPFQLAVSSTPRDETDIDVLASPSVGIRHILTLTKETPLPSTWFRGKAIRHTHLPIEDLRAPTMEQIDLFLSLASDPASTPLLVHCGGGKGRAGTLIACWMVAFGFGRGRSEGWSFPKMSAKEAIDTLRRIRPGSIESVAQEEAVRLYAKTINKRGSPFAETEPEPEDDEPGIVGKIQGADLLILVGLPGSGKSWFRNVLLARDESWTYVSGDEDGGKAVLDSAARQPRGTKLIVDRCNATVKDRKLLLDLVHHATTPVAIHFDFTSSLCISRAQRRPNHPSLPPGNRVIAAIKQFQSILVPPRLSEGFTAVVTVKSFGASRKLVRQISAPITLFKFPRTPHLINLGSATPDDIISTSQTTSSRVDVEVVITEKVDGANVAWSLDGNKVVRIQNRSRYVNAKTHAQFKKLDLWLEEHREELYQILDRDETFPERYILFGEWMAATHSVEYDDLPDLFIAFDLYDRTTSSFATRHEITTLLQNTRIKMTLVVYHGPTLPDDRALVEMVAQKSSFTNGRLEGIYVKWEDEQKVVERAKIVRADFIAGNEHWTRGELRWNKVTRSEEGEEER